MYPRPPVTNMFFWFIFCFFLRICVFANLPICESAYQDRKSTRLNSSHVRISYAVFCLKKKNDRHLHKNLANGPTCWTAQHPRRIPRLHGPPRHCPTLPGPCSYPCAALAIRSELSVRLS